MVIHLPSSPEELLILVAMIGLILYLTYRINNLVKSDQNKELHRKLARALNIQFDFVQVNLREGESVSPLLILAKNKKKLTEGSQDTRVNRGVLPVRLLADFNEFVLYVCRLGAHIQRTGILYGVVVSVVSESDTKVLHLTVLDRIYNRYIAGDFLRKLE